MATHSGVLAWRIPGMGEPGGLPSMGLHRVRHEGRDLAAAAVDTKIHIYSSPSVGLLYSQDCIHGFNQPCTVNSNICIEEKNPYL